ncbi:MAG: response regulator transcription factor [Chromatiales bacterium]|nr:response regulator transcription factor [Chromatiales bacterium]
MDDLQNSLLLVDDDQIFCQMLGRSLTKRGFNVVLAHNGEDAILQAQQSIPAFAVIDLNMPGNSGLALIKQLHSLDSTMRIVMLTGYASISTAVEAIKLGAIHYLAKPADSDEIIAALYRDEGNDGTVVNSKPLSVNRLEWEHLQRVLTENNGNISATARALNMHRRTLQRKLQKRPHSE